MAETSGDIQIYNPDKQISEQITLKNLITHSTSMNLARRGIPDEASEKPSTFNQRVSQRFKGLNEIISAQQTLIVDIIAVVEHNSRNSWKKLNKSDDDKIKNVFEDDDNDFNELNAILLFLDQCEQNIITARKTKMFEDDFVWEKEDNMGEKILELSPNFFNMLKELESSFREIHGVMLRNKIVSNGVSVDEELEDKQKEEEAMRRIIES